MLSDFGRRQMVGGEEGSLRDELLREQHCQEANERELNLYRSGSAPPTVEGSLSAVGGLYSDHAFLDFAAAKNENQYVSEEELRSDPSYLQYYYSNANLNPRLPPPLLSKEDWRYSQRLKAPTPGLGGIGDRKKVSTDDITGGRSVLSMPPGFDSRKLESESEKAHVSAEWGSDGLIGLPGLGLGNKQKSLGDIFQDPASVQNDPERASPVMRHLSRPGSRNAFGGNVDYVGTAENDLAYLRRELTSVDALQPRANDHGSSVVQTIIPPTSFTYAAALGTSLSRSSSPDPQLIARAPSPHIPPIGDGRVGISEKRGITTTNSSNVVVVSSVIHDSTDLVAALSGMNLSADNVKGGTNWGGSDMNSPTLISDRRIELQKYAFSPSNSYSRGSPTSTLTGAGSFTLQHQHVDGTNSSFATYGLSGYSMNPTVASMMTGQLGIGNLPPSFVNVAAASGMTVPIMDPRALGGNLASGPNLETASQSHNLGRMGSSMVGGLQAPFVDPAYLQYLRTSEYAAAQLAGLNDLSAERNYCGEPYLNLHELHKAYLGTLLLAHKSQYAGNPAFGTSYPGSPFASPGMPTSQGGPGSPIMHNKFNMVFPSGISNGRIMGYWGCKMDGSFASSLLEELKSNKTKSLELSDISGHVIEFSVDQYGSRFIQQKLETGTIEEKTMVYQEITPQAHTLMTDVFGNYVIQKFFEHGLDSQRRELGSKLFGHVLTLSLQMYGCRVIQKAIEVVDLDQKTQIVEELDGHVMRCVRDQNGNHVIQKCIECVPEEAIQFILATFYDQVVTLSTHPYGCRVIQRVLEHCKDSKTLSKVMDEVLSSVSMLAQDQYGNYVVQHVLEHGETHERTTIINELVGRIVKMSQQKFASNVVEKCLTFSGPAERQLLVNEILGTTDENEPLQAMMKDQFGNYVVQKVLETCNDRQRELILTRIKVHLNALKKYTYGKHIVARVEKLVAAGERRIYAHSSLP